MPILSALLATVVAVAAPAPNAAPQAAAKRDALVTAVKPLTPTLQDDRLAAVTYLDDTLTLLGLAQGHLKAGHREQARAVLLSASGKLSTAHLLMFKDRAFSRAIAPLSLRAEEAFQAAGRDAEQASKLTASLSSDLRPLYRAQTARLGGGAGQALEPLNHIQR